MKIPVNLGKDSYDIIIMRGAHRKAGELIDLNRKVLIITDSGVPSEYHERVAQSCKEPVTAVLPAGEESKSMANFEKLCSLMLEKGFGRGDCVVAVGGGVAGDLAGFAASCYMRGVDFYNMPTTLLSQVDSSVGGKTAVDLCGVKNIVGSFYQPKAVIIDSETLETLDERQFSCGAAEIIKMAATFDRELFEAIEKKRIKDDPETFIAGALKIKAAVVEKDEKEAGLRRALNFGHTIGHGIESVTGLLHGEAVALGMIPMCGDKIRPRMEAVLRGEGLAVNLAEAARQGKTEPFSEEQAAAAAEVMLHDKKAKDGSVVTVHADDIGSYRFETMNKEQLAGCLKEVL